MEKYQEGKTQPPSVIHKGSVEGVIYIVSKLQIIVITAAESYVF